MSVLFGRQGEPGVPDDPEGLMRQVGALRVANFMRLIEKFLTSGK